MGVDTIKPFLQDVVRFDGLLGSLGRSFVADPLFMPQIVRHVGIPTLLEWLGHVGMIGIYTLADIVVSPVLTELVNTFERDPRKKFRLRRQMDAWKYGSGRDYVLPSDEGGSKENTDVSTQNRLNEDEVGRKEDQLKSPQLYSPKKIGTK